MSGRTARPTPARSGGSKLIGAGAAGLVGLAGVLALAPAASAAPADSPSSTTPDAGSTAGSTTPSAKKVEPSYGFQKYRVGVQVKDGSYVPEGTTTVGTELTITDTGPDGDGGTETTTTTCTTDESTVEDGSTRSYCLAPRSALKAARKAAAASTEPFDPSDFSEAPPQQQFYAGPEHTVTITQKTVNANLLIDSSTGTVEPCEATVISGVCVVPDGEGLTIKGTSVVFDDPGLPPVAGDDSATTTEGTAVGIAVAANDTAKAPVESVSIKAEPKHGTARLIAPETTDPSPSSSGSSGASGTTGPTGSTDEPTPTETITLESGDRRAAGVRSLAAVSSYRAIYTPAAGFTGVDTFDYTITTANGTATATVTVTVTGAAASASVSDTGDAGVSGAAESDDPLADTGTQSDDLLGYAAALLAAGGGALAIGRQRRRGRHAR